MGSADSPHGDSTFSCGRFNSDWLHHLRVEFRILSGATQCFFVRSGSSSCLLRMLLEKQITLVEAQYVCKPLANATDFEELSFSW